MSGMSETREMVDFVRLSDWMDAECLGSGAIENIHWIGGGTQNVLVLFRRAARDYVLRRPPRHSLSNGSKVMMREARLLAALSGSAVPHPGLIAACPDETVLGCAFYLMEPVDGLNITQGMPGAYSDPAAATEIGNAMVDAILALAAIDPIEAGLGDFGRLDNYLERQADRWSSQLESYTRYRGWPGVTSLPGFDPVRLWLEDHRPASFIPGIVHGDYHLANVMFRRDRPSIAAVVDWELGTVGDPRLDLGWMVATWPDRNGESTGSGIAVPGASVMPSVADLVARYQAGTQRDMSGFPWFAVLACFKLAILQEGSFARACAGQAEKEVGRWSHARAVEVMGKAEAFIRSLELSGSLFA